MKALLLSMTLFYMGEEPQTLQTPNPNRIEDVQVRGNRRIPTATILYNLQTKMGDTFNPDVIQRDIRTLSNIGDLREFQRFMQLLAARTAQVLNLTDFSRDLGVSVNTVKKWLSILEASRMVYLLPPYYQHFGKRVTKARKAYFLDCGLVCYLTGIETETHALNGPLAGALFETYCIQETLKTLLFHGQRPRLYYARTYNGLEVDLLLEGKRLELFPCEIKLTKMPRPEMAAAIRRFSALFPKLRIGAGRILCLTDDDHVLAGDLTAQALPRSR